jgi:hypothetical protein
MNIMVSFESTEDYILKAENETEAIKIVQMIWDHKQESQNDLLKQYDIDYSLDVSKKYVEVEDQEEDNIVLDYKVTFVMTGKSPEDAIDNFHEMMKGGLDYIPPIVEPVINDEYELLTGIKAEGTA